MSSQTRKEAREAQRQMKYAGDHAKRAKEIFKKIGDKEGEKHASTIEKVANDGNDYVDKRLGKDDN